MLGMADGAVKAILIMAGTMAFMVEDFAVTHIMAMVLIMAGTMVDSMGETDGGMDLITADTIMAGAETEDSAMPIIVEAILMEA